MTDYQLLNDSSELHFSINTADSILSQMNQGGYSDRVAELIGEWRLHLRTTMSSCQLYVVSFSEDKDNLSLWRAYGADGGVSLGFATSYPPALYR